MLSASFVVLQPPWFAVLRPAWVGAPPRLALSLWALNVIQLAGSG